MSCVTSSPIPSSPSSHLNDKDANNKAFHISDGLKIDSINSIAPKLHVEEKFYSTPKNLNLIQNEMNNHQNFEFDQKNEKTNTLRSDTNYWAPECTNPEKESLLFPGSDWLGYFKYTNETNSANFSYLKAFESSSSTSITSATISLLPTTLDKLNQLEEEMMISTTAASIPAVQTNQTAFRVGPRLVRRRASALELTISPLHLPTSSYLDSNSSKEPLFAGLSSLGGVKEQQTPPIVPPLNLLFSTPITKSASSPWDHLYPQQNPYQIYQTHFLGSLSSPKSPELDPGGYLASGTLHHCLSPDSSIPQCNCYDIDHHKCLPSYHPNNNIFNGGDQIYSATDNFDFESSAKDAVAAAWSSLLEGTIIDGKRDHIPTQQLPSSFRKKNNDSMWKPNLSSSAISFPSLDSFKLNLPGIEKVGYKIPQLLSLSSPGMTSFKKPILIPADKLIIVTFKNGRSELFSFSNDKLALNLLDYVLVDGDRGTDLGVISAAVSQSWALALIRRWDSLFSTCATRLSISEADKAGEDLFASWDVVANVTCSFGDKVSVNGAGNHHHHLLGTPPPSSATMYFSNPKDLTAKRRVLRLATSDEIRDWRAQRQEESLAVLRCTTVVRSHRLPMTIVDAEYQHDRAKLTFYYVSVLGRVDFREMVRELFRIYKARIWMCSIGDGGMDSSAGEELDLKAQLPHHSAISVE